MLHPFGMHVWFLFVRVRFTFSIGYIVIVESAKNRTNSEAFDPFTVFMAVCSVSISSCSV